MKHVAKHGDKQTLLGVDGDSDVKPILEGNDNPIVFPATSEQRMPLQNTCGEAGEKIGVSGSRPGVGSQSLSQTEQGAGIHAHVQSDGRRFLQARQHPPGDGAPPGGDGDPPPR
jgi:hypothetical protein